MTADMYSFMAACKKNGVNEHEWITDVLNRGQSINNKDLYQQLAEIQGQIRNLNTGFLGHLQHIDEKAKVRTDEWKGYRPISKQYDITQVPSDKGGNFKALH
ncbi:MAG: hypothetical protein ACJA2S_004104, partial [Cyclobacteriaceae bacterium]